jgi:hypothetical protein
MTSNSDPFNGITTNTYAAALNSSPSYQNAQAQPLPLGFDTATSQPVYGWRPFYKQLYEKYAVLGCYWEIHCRHADESIDKNLMLSVIKEGPNQIPTMSPGDKIDNHKWMIKKIRPNRGATPWHQNGVAMKGYYRPGDFGEEVVTDALAETWTDFDSQPAVAENLHCELAHATDTRTGSTTDIYVRHKLKYIIQFKGLKEKWRHWQRGTSVMSNDAVYGYDMYYRFP